MNRMSQLAALVVLLLAVAVGCAEREDLVAPQQTESSGVMEAVEAVDGVYLLPPLGENPKDRATFASGLQLIMTIRDATTGLVVESFSTDEGTLVEFNDDAYQADWGTKAAVYSTGGRFILSVRRSSTGQLLIQTDFEIVAKMTGNHPTQPINALSIKGGRSVPVRVRVEQHALSEPPVALFSATPDTGYAPLLVTFDASASYDPDGDPVAFTWDLGDSVTATGAVVEHTYELPGMYDVKLIIDDGRGNTAFHISQVVVEEEPAPDLSHPWWDQDQVSETWILGSGNSGPATIYYVERFQLLYRWSPEYYQDDEDYSVREPDFPPGIVIVTLNNYAMWLTNDWAGDHLGHNFGWIEIEGYFFDAELGAKPFKMAFARDLASGLVYAQDITLFNSAVHEGPAPRAILDHTFTRVRLWRPVFSPVSPYQHLTLKQHYPDTTFVREWVNEHGLEPPIIE